MPESPIKTTQNDDVPNSALLISRYNSLAEIVQDKHGKALAFAQDMSYEDWLNYHMKNFIIRQRVLNQPVSIKIDGQLVELTNPDTNKQLIYSDFITDRSGPKFGGYLDETAGSEYLSGNVSKSKVDVLIDKQKQACIQYCQDNNLPIPDEKTLDLATSIFKRKHQSQRRLSDFDLTARELGILEKSILKEVEKHLDESEKIALANNPELIKEIGQTAWQVGGAINTSIIKEMLNAKEPSPKSYKERVMATRLHPDDPSYKPPEDKDHNPNLAFTHMLIDGVGKTVRQEYLNFYEAIGQQAPTFYFNTSSGKPDTYYGLGIPFLEASIRKVTQSGNLKLSTKSDDTEIGDIICDNSSIFGHVFNPNNNFQQIRDNLITQQKIPDELFQHALQQATSVHSEQHKIFEQTFKNLSDDPRLTSQQKIAVDEALTSYLQRHQFMETGLIFEEAGKKEAQSQLFRSAKKTGKLIGNISDTAPFLDRAQKKIEKATRLNDRKALTNAKAHLQMTMLSTLISVTRWGISSENNKQVGNTNNIISAVEFQQSLNERSYHASGSTGIRKQLKLDAITIEEAQRRIASYEKGFGAIWQNINDNDMFFNLVDNYKQAKADMVKANISGDPELIHQRQEQLSQITQQLSNFINVMIKEQMPELSEKLDQMSPGADKTQARTQMVQGLVKQLDEALCFGQMRLYLDDKRKLQSERKEHIDSQPVDFQKAKSSLEKSMPGKFNEQIKAQLAQVKQEASPSARTLINYHEEKIRQQIPNAENIDNEPEKPTQFNK
jgi:hypothetical protein